MDKEILKIISYLNILELPNDNLITSDQVNEAYRKLSHIYHPDVANARYKDGKKFVELKDAHDYLIDNIDYVNNLIKNSFSLSSGQSRYSTSDAAYEKWKQEQEFQRRRQEEENRRRQEEERIRKQQEEARRREEARKREEERKRQEELRKEKERQEKIKQKKLYDARKVSILVDVQQFLGSFNKDDYYDAEYKQINDLVGSFIHNVNSDAYSAASDIDNGFTELKEAVNNVKTKGQILRVKRITRWFIAGASFAVFVFVMIILTVNVFVPSAKYNKAVKQMNKGYYAEAIATFQSLGSYRDSESKVNETKALQELDNTINSLDKFKPSGDLNKVIDNYKSLGGTVNFDYVLDYNETIKQDKLTDYGYLESADRLGYTFENWIIDDFINDAENLKCTIILKPVYKPTIYKIDFDLNGGNGDYPITYTIEDVLYVNIPSRIGYTFIGWITPENSILLNDLKISESTGNKKYIAQWQPNSYNVSFDAKGGSNISEFVVKFDDKYELPIPTKTGYTFLGWFNNADDEKIDNISYWKINTDVNLYAKWQITEYSINIDYAGGTANNKEYYFMTSDTFTINNPTRKGYDFIGWNVDGNNELVDNVVIQKGSIGNKNLVANWKVIYYNIEYELDGANNNSNNKDKYTIEEEIQLYSPIKKGYTFKGWFIDNNYSKQVTQIEIGSTGSKKIYALFEINKYKITVQQEIYAVSFDLRGGTGDIATQYVSSTNPLKYPGQPYKSNSCFLGWFTDEQCTNKYDFTQTVKKNIVLYAGWYTDSEHNAIPIRTNQDKYTMYDGNVPGPFEVNDYSGTYYIFSVLKAGKIGMGFQAGNTDFTTIKITNITKNIEIAEIKMGDYKSINFEASEGDVIQMYCRLHNDKSWFCVYGIDVTIDDGGKGVEQSFIQQIEYNQNFAIQTRNLDGYTFLGYYDENNQQITDSNGHCLSNYLFDKDITVYEKWSKNE